MLRSTAETPGEYNAADLGRNNRISEPIFLECISIRREVALIYPLPELVSLEWRGENTEFDLHSLTLRKPLNTLADLLHYTSGVRATNYWVTRDQETHGLHVTVDGIEGGRNDSHQELTWSGLGNRTSAKGEGTALGLQEKCFLRS